jgi:hypothetical protein
MKSSGGKFRNPPGIVKRLCDMVRELRSFCFGDSWSSLCAALVLENVPTASLLTIAAFMPTFEMQLGHETRVQKLYPQ